MRTRHRSTIRRAVAAAVLCAALPALMPGTGLAASTATGSAEAVNTLASLTYDTTTVKVGVDRAASTWGAAPSAEAAMDFLISGATKLGGGSRMASNEAESGSEALGTGATAINGLVSATITGATVGATVEAERATSSAVVTMGDLNLLDGLVTATSAQTATASTVSPGQSDVERTLQIATVQVLSIRKLLERLGVDPVALTCAGIEAAGAELGVDTAQACTTQAAAQAAIGDVQAELDDRAAVLTADLQIAQATVAGITIVTQPLIDLAAAYGVDLGGLLGLTLPGASRDALIAEIDSRLTAVTAGGAAAAAGTCAEVQQAAGDVIAAVPSLAGTLTPLRTAVVDACDLLQGLLDGLLDTSLLGLDGVTVGLSAVAAPDAPLAQGSGSIGAITVGLRSLTLAGVTSVGSALQTAITDARAETGDALTALGIGAFPDPEIDILGVQQSAGRDQNGTWFAHVSVTGLHVAIPPVPISLPAGPNLGSVLGAPAAPASAPGGTDDARVRASESAAAPVATTPQIIVDAAVFTGDAFYTPAAPVGPPDGGLGGSGSPLPRTGLGTHWLAAAALLMLAGAGTRTVRAGR